MTLSIARIELGYANQFLDAVLRSEKLHRPWVSPPHTAEAVQEFIERCNGDRNLSFVALSETDLVGCINLREIIRGPFQSAFLGFYAFVPFDGKGLMKQAMRLVIAEAFTTHGLHRLEANIQPANERSKRFAQSLGFRYEGFSPDYLKIAGEWRDHERYAMTAEEWNRHPIRPRAL